LTDYTEMSTENLLLLLEWEANSGKPVDDQKAKRLLSAAAARIEHFVGMLEDSSAVATLQAASPKREEAAADLDGIAKRIRAGELDVVAVAGVESDDHGGGSIWAVEPAQPDYNIDQLIGALAVMRHALAERSYEASDDFDPNPDK